MTILKNVIDQMIEGLQIIGPDWRYLYLNAAATQHGRKSAEELTGRTMMECYPGIENTPLFHDMRFVMETRTPRRIENEFTYPDGKKTWFELYIEPHDWGILIRSMDITDRKILEEQFRSAQRMEALAQLVAGIAHDFNNRLALILIAVEMSKLSLFDRPEETAQYLDRILEATRHSSNLISRMMSLCRTRALVLKVEDINEILSQAVGGLVTLVGRNVRVDFQPGPRCRSQVDRTELEQVVLNLCINARDAMPDGGTIRIRTEAVELDQAWADAHGAVTPGSFVLLEVSDTGTGMDRQTLARALDPLFTTKPEGKGTGLGLSMVKGFVQQCNGYIWLYSEPGHGTTVKLYLPRSEQVLALQEQQAGTGEDLRGGETILLVEDDDLLRAAYQKAIQAYGYDVRTAGTARDAEAVFNEHSARIVLVLTDVLIDSVKGPELVASFQKRKAGLKAVFMSGHAEELVKRDGGDAKPRFVLVRKPALIINLLRAVRGVLEGTLVDATL